MFLLRVFAAVIVVPAVFFMPVTIGAAGYILPMLSVTFSDVIAQDKANPGESIALWVPVIQDA
jgi:hypothetical protein